MTEPLWLPFKHDLGEPEHHENYTRIEEWANQQRASQLRSGIVTTIDTVSISNVTVTEVPVLAPGAQPTDYDTDNYFQSGAIVIPADGDYDIAFGFSWQASPTGQRWVNIGNHNYTAWTSQIVPAVPGGSPAEMLNQPAWVVLIGYPFVKGDTPTFRVEQNSGGSLTGNGFVSVQLRGKR